MKDEGGTRWGKIYHYFKKIQNFILEGDWNAKHTSWNYRHNYGTSIQVRKWVDQNFKQIFMPREPTYPASNNYLGFTVIRNFPYFYGI